MDKFNLYINIKLIGSEKRISKFYPVLDERILTGNNSSGHYMIVKKTEESDEVVWMSYGDRDDYLQFKEQNTELEKEAKLNGPVLVKKRACL